MTKKTKNNNHTIVGIGTSAGGIKILEKLFEIMPVDSGLSFVIIQHLSPHQKSELVSIIQRRTKMQVRQIEKDMEAEPDQVYITPPHQFISLHNNRFALKSFEESEKEKVYLPIDYFLRSLASDKKSHSTAIILTGTGSDGALGIKDIKEAGGLVITQDPETAEFDSMPRSAIDTGIVDAILSPEDIPRYLKEFKDLTDSDKEESFADKANEELVRKIFKLISEHFDYDFSKYKKNTIFRRIRKRMVVTEKHSSNKYMKFLENNPDEIEALFREFLIGVTYFFRDFESFKILKKDVFPQILSREEKSIRIWVAACSTGEEAYSIAILLKDYLEEHNIEKEIQIFASDIDTRALEVARIGKYSENIVVDVPKDLLNRYFVKKDSSYFVHKEIRDMIVFAEHSILRDPPYSSLDFISCRNFLIYIESDMQTHVLNTFHYALKSNGFLFLGGSETQRIADDVFKTTNKKARIFQKVDNRKVIADYLLFSKKGASKKEKDDQGRELPNRELSYKEFAEKTALKDYLNPFLLINKKGELLYSLGNCEKYFKFSTGEPQNNVVNLAREGLKVPISNALRKINSEKKKLLYENIMAISGTGKELVDLMIQPVNLPPAFSNFMILTLKPSEKDGKTEDKNENKIHRMSEERDEYIRQMESDLNETREYLKNVVEELETSNEELKSANEEAQSTNEELQSSNEELESSKEELQSVNEELNTSNFELQRKIEETTRFTNDLNNFLHGTDIGILFLDKGLRIKRFTPQIRGVINLEDKDIGRSIEDFNVNFLGETLVQDIQRVLDNLITIEKEISKNDDRQYWMRIKPYRTIDDKIDGVVITFTDITEKNLIQKKAEKEQKRYKLLFDNMDNGFAIHKVIRDNKGQISDFKIREINPAFKNLMQLEPEQVLDKSLFEIFENEKFRDILLSAGKNALSGAHSQQEHFFKNLNKYFRINYFSNEGDYLVTFIQDITSLKKEIETHQHLVSIIESSDDAIFSESTEGKILSWNEGAVHLYGYSESEAIGNKANRLFAYPKNDGDIELIKKVRNGQKVTNHETVHKKKDGNLIHVSLTKSPIKDDNGVVVAISNISKDITTLKKREEILKTAKIATEQASAIKSLFLANMSHEIRTPLNSIIGFTEIMEDELKSRRHKKHLRTIHDSGIQLLNLINDIVDFSRIEAKELPVHTSNVDLISLMKKTRDQYQGYSKKIKNEKNIDFRLNIPEGEKSRIIVTDEKKLQQMFHNLLSNAFKYTDEGFIEFGYNIDKDKDSLMFFVKDSGIGITEEDREKVFNRFHQSEGVSGKAISGTGLGLAISKGLAELMGGKMWLESEKGKGSEFCFTLPLINGENIKKEKNISKEKEMIIPKLHGKKILLAEDDEHTIEMMKFLLEKTGADIFIAKDGGQAMDVFNKEEFDLILLDIRLPVKNGYEVISQIKDKNPKVPVIAQSAFAMPEQVKKSHEAGFEEHITKPVTMDIFFSMLNKYLG